MLTVDFERLGLQRGDLTLDLGCGAGRHAFEMYRRGARVVAIDTDGDELQAVSTMFDAMAEEWEAAPHEARAVRADALRLPFPDDTFDRVVAAEVLEHIPDDRHAITELVRVLKPGGTIAVTVPRFWPEVVCWSLSREYHEVEGGHVRIYRADVLEGQLVQAGLETIGRHHAHALHSGYWWLKCAVGVDNEANPLVKAYHKVLVWDLMAKPTLTRTAEKLLNPVAGKSVVLYATKP